MKNSQKGIVGAVCSVATIVSILLSGGNVRSDQETLELIGNAEGCRREPYTCPAGILTDGLGNTHGVKAGTSKTDKQIAADWEKNILIAEKCVDKYANGEKLPKKVFGAAVSLAFRTGCGKVKSSAVFTYLRTGPLFYDKACAQFPRWKYSGDIILPGLEIRSGKEEALCLKGLHQYEN